VSLATAKQAVKRIPRLSTGFAALDDALGGGLPRGRVVGLVGAPGIGKSTLALQIAGAVSDAGKRGLYAAGEEPLVNVAATADRIGVAGDNLDLTAETAITRWRLDKTPSLVVVDSLSVMSATAVESGGDVARLRAAVAALVQRAQKWNCAVLALLHVTKKGDLAGPKVVEHLVDAVLWFKQDAANPDLRTLETGKNRLGKSGATVDLKMTAGGLREIK